MISLQGMRDHKHLRWPLYVIFAIVIVSFVFFYGWKSGGRGPQTVHFARVKSDGGGFSRWEYITNQDMVAAEMALIQQKAQFMPQSVLQRLGRAPFKELVTRPEEAREAANRILVERAAKEKGIAVTREDIIDFLKNQPGMTQQAAMAVARENGFESVNDWVEYLREQMQADRSKTLVSKLAHASLFELWQEYLIDREKIGLELAAFPNKDFEKEVVVNEQDLIDYLAAHKDELRVPAKRQYGYVKLSKDDLRSKARPTNEQLQAYYQQNQAKYREEAGSKAEELMVSLPQDASTTRSEIALNLLGSLRARAAKSDSWTTLSKQLMEEHKGEGWLIFSRMSPWISEKDTNVSADYQKALRTLTGDQVSSPILENGRAIILRVKEKRAAGVPSFDKIKTQVETDYVKKQIDDQFDAAYEQWTKLRKDGDKITGYKVSDFAKAVALQDELTTTVEQTAIYIPEIGPLAEHGDYLRSLELNQVSDPIRTDNALVVLQVVSEKESYDPSLAEVRDKVDKAVRAERSVERSKLAAQQNLDIVRGGADFKTALADAPIKPLTSPPITRTESVQALGSPLLNFKQEAASLKVGSTGMSPYGYDPEKPMGYAVWKVASIQQPTKAEFARERYQFMQDYLQIQQLAVIQEWLADQRKAANFELLEAAKPAQE